MVVRHEERVDPGGERFRSRRRVQPRFVLAEERVDQEARLARLNQEPCLSQPDDNRGAQLDLTAG
jgi:hypothetical protein